MLLAVILLAALPQDRVITHADPEFTLALSRGFRDSEKNAEGAAYTFVKPDEDPGRRILITIIIGTQEAKQGIEAITETTAGQVFEETSKGRRIKRVKHEWRGHLIDVLEMESDDSRTDTVTYVAEIPLKRRAISLCATGTRANRPEVFWELRRALENLEGPSNWAPAREWRAVRKMPYLTIGVPLLFAAYGVFRLILFRRRAHRFRWLRAAWLLVAGGGFLAIHLLKPAYARVHVNPPGIATMAIWLALVAIGLAAWNAVLAVRAANGGLMTDD